MFGPRGMPDKLRESIPADFQKVAKDPIIAQRLGDTGQIMSVLGPAELGARPPGAARQARRARQDAWAQSGAMRCVQVATMRESDDPEAVPFDSCSQIAPDGGRGARVARHGAAKPAGSARKRKLDMPGYVGGRGAGVKIGAALLPVGQELSFRRFKARGRAPARSDA